MTWSLFSYLILVSLLFALLEIQIEGANGWSEKLPAWKIKNPFRRVIGWTHFDGYHFYGWLLFGALFHLPYFFGFPFSLKNEFVVIESIFIFFAVEDFLWFVFNPAWGIKKFFTKEIPWHPRKIILFPQDYWIQLCLFFLLQLMKFHLTGDFLW